MFCHNTQHYIWRKPNTASTSAQILHTSMVVEEWWFGPVLKPQDLGMLQLLSHSWTLLFSQIGSRKRTMTRSTAANLQHNGWKTQGSRCCNGLVKAQTSTWLKYCGATLKELCIDQYHKPKRTEAMLEQKTMLRLQVFAAKGGSTNYWIMKCT